MALAGQDTEKLTILGEVSDLLIFHQEIDQKIKKEVTKVENEKLHQGVIFR